MKQPFKNIPVTALQRHWQERRHLWVFAFVLILGTAVFWQIPQADFQLEDYPGIVYNPFIKNSNLHVLWLYSPLGFITNLSFTINHAFGGLNALGWYWVNIFLHVFNSFLLYQLFLVTLQTPHLKKDSAISDPILGAVMAALIFLLHPVQLETIMFVSHRGMLLSALFYLSTFWCYAKGRLSGRWVYYICAWLLCGLGTLSHSLNMLVLPLTIILYELCFFGTSRKIDYKRLVSLAIFFLPLIVVLLNPRIPIEVGDAAFSSAKEIFLTKLNVLAVCIAMLFVPFNPSFEQDYQLSHHFSEFSSIVSFIALFIVGYLALKNFRQRPWLTFGFLWIILSVIPYVLLLFAPVIHDGWLYLAAVGFAFFLSYFCLRIFKYAMAFAACMVFFLSLFLVLTQYKIVMHSDGISSVYEELSVNPESPRLQVKLGLKYVDARQWERAAKAFQRALLLNPDTYTRNTALSNLAYVYLEEKKFQEAKEILEPLLAAMPGTPLIQINLAETYFQLGEPQKALELYNEVLRNNPYQGQAHLGRGNIFYSQGKWEEASEAFSRAVYLSPDSAIAHYNLGNTYFQLQFYFEALKHYTAASRLDPQWAEVHNNTGNIYFFFGNYKEARNFYAKSLALQPSGQSYFNLANTLHALGQLKEAEEAIAKAVDSYRREGKDALAEQLEQRLQQNQQDKSIRQ